MEDIYKQHGVNVDRLFNWLQQPKQGIHQQVAMHILRLVADELAQGEKRYLDPLYYPEGLRNVLAAQKLPEHFWIDNYVLELCKWLQEDAINAEKIANIDTKNLLKIQDDQLNHLAEVLHKLDDILLFLNSIRSFFSMPGWMKWTRSQ